MDWEHCLATHPQSAFMNCKKKSYIYLWNSKLSKYMPCLYKYLIITNITNASHGSLQIMLVKVRLKTYIYTLFYIFKFFILLTSFSLFLLYNGGKRQWSIIIISFMKGKLSKWEVWQDTLVNFDIKISTLLLIWFYSDINIIVLYL